MYILELLMQKTHGIRRMGAAAVDLAYVAAGRLTVFTNITSIPGIWPRERANDQRSRRYCDRFQRRR
jgi:hypothetical protein